MSEKETVEEIKARLKVEVPGEEVTIEEEVVVIEVENESSPLVDELSNMGRKFADTMKNGWNSQERAQIESDVREGFRSFANEVDKVFREIKSSPTTDRVRSEMSNVSSKIESEDITQKARIGFAKGLRWFSDELGKLAESINTDADVVAEPAVQTPPSAEAQPAAEAQPMAEAQPKVEAEPATEAQPTAEAQPEAEAPEDSSEPKATG